MEHDALVAPFNSCLDFGRKSKVLMAFVTSSAPLILISPLTVDGYVPSARFSSFNRTSVQKGCSSAITSKGKTAAQKPSSNLFPKKSKVDSSVGIKEFCMSKRKKLEGNTEDRAAEDQEEVFDEDTEQQGAINCLKYSGPKQDTKSAAKTDSSQPLNKLYQCLKKRRSSTTPTPPPSLSPSGHSNPLIDCLKSCAKHSKKPHPHEQTSTQHKLSETLKYLQSIENLTKEIAEKVHKNSCVCEETVKTEGLDKIAKKNENSSEKMAHDGTTCKETTPSVDPEKAKLAKAQSSKPPENSDSSKTMLEVKCKLKASKEPEKHHKDCMKKLLVRNPKASTCNKSDSKPKEPIDKLQTAKEAEEQCDQLKASLAKPRSPLLCHPANEKSFTTTKKTIEKDCKNETAPNSDSEGCNKPPEEACKETSVADNSCDQQITKINSVCEQVMATLANSKAGLMCGDEGEWKAEAKDVEGTCVDVKKGTEDEEGSAQDQSMQKGLKGLTVVLPEDEETPVRDMGLLGQCMMMVKNKKMPIVQPATDEELDQAMCKGKKYMCRLQKFSVGEKLIVGDEIDDCDDSAPNCAEDGVEKVLKCALVKDGKNGEKFVCTEVLSEEEHRKGKPLQIGNALKGTYSRNRNNKIKIISNKLVCRACPAIDGSGKKEIFCSMATVEEIKTPKNCNKGGKKRPEKTIKSLTTYKDLKQKSKDSKKSDRAGKEERPQCDTDKPKEDNEESS